MDNHFDYLPIEIIGVIAAADEGAYRGLLCLPQFARSLTPADISAYKKQFGYTKKRYRTKDYDIDFVIYKKHGLIHRNGGLPAVIYCDGSKEWYRNGLLHRDGGLPAVKYTYDSFSYYINYIPHHCVELITTNCICCVGYGCKKRKNYAGVTTAIYNNKSIITREKRWYKNGQRHREGDLPAVKYANGDLEWWFNNELSRDGDLPAVICNNGHKEWYNKGKRHRIGGQAVIFPEGDGFWYVDGHGCTDEEEYNDMLERYLSQQYYFL